MSPSAFEAHCGASSSRKWRVSLRHASEKCTMGQWLEERGLYEPVLRGEGRAPRLVKEPRHPRRPEPPSLDFGSRMSGGSSQILGWAKQRSGAGSDETANEEQSLGEFPRSLPGGQPGRHVATETSSRISDQPTEVRVTCRGRPGILNLVTWKVRCLVCFLLC